MYFTLFFLSLCVGDWLATVMIDGVGVGVDDVDIFMVYARHLSEGHGLVYNIGGERVEGFSSPLWVVLGALAYCLSDDPSFWLRFITLVSLALSLSALYWEGALGLGLKPFRPRILLCGVLWLLLNPFFIFWTVVSGMETGLWCALIAACSAVLLRTVRKRTLDVFLWGGLLSGLILCRPEGPLWAECFWVLLCGWAYLRKAFHGLWIRLVGLQLTILLVLGTLLVFRLSYFGYLFPNTYYAKMSSDVGYHIWNGALYFTRYMASHPLPSFCLLAMCIAMYSALAPFFHRTKPRPVHLFKTLAISFIIGLGFALPIYEGGDHFAGWRFYQPLWPLLWIPLTWLVLYLSGHRQWKREHLRLLKVPLRFGAMLIVVLLLATEWSRYRSSRLPLEMQLTQRNRACGRLLDSVFPDEDRPVVAVLCAGGIKRTYSGPVFDIMGLNHTAMAHYNRDRYGLKNHAAFEADVFYQENPELLLPEIMGSDQPFSAVQYGDS